jgi:ferredoxin-NADP reductase/Na+-transporting NADH:ubiquinone oxidoreductase subunit NqrB
MLKALDRWINNTTMYRLTLYCLMGVSLGAVVLGGLGWLPYAPVRLVSSGVLMVVAAYILNRVLAKMWSAPANPESTLITALILFLIMPPARNLAEAGGLVLITAVAICSKYVFAYRHRHLFNPAAVGAFLAPWLTGSAVLWWVGAPAMLPLTLLAGILIVKKIRRWGLVAAFTGAAVVSAASRQWGLAITDLFIAWPLVFFGTVMLTEPITTPPTRKLQLVYGAIVGLLFTAPFSFGPVYGTPELALLIGNLFSWLTSLKRRLALKVQEVAQLAPEVYHFTFNQPAPFKYRPGQYLEWTFPHKGSDSRGIRRYFTIASAPGEPLSIGVKIGQQASSFKQALRALKPGDKVTAGELGGDFVWPKDTSTPLVWIAGGIGITPFRAMAKDMLARPEKRQIILFYCVPSAKEAVYLDIFEEAEKLGLKTVVLTDKDGFLTPEKVTSEMPEWQTSQYYLSGPNAMVVAYKKLLKEMGILRRQIKTDYFPGY